MKPSPLQLPVRAVSNSLYPCSWVLALSVLVASMGLGIAPGWAAAVAKRSDQALIADVSGLRSSKAETVGIFRSGFEATENACETRPDSDNDGLLDPFCIQLFTPPDPAVVAPPINPTIITDFIDANAFIGEGTQPIQVRLQPNLIERYRAAVTRGRVLDEAGDPLPGVLVRVLDHPEYGYTYTRADGYYDLLVNGGGEFVLDFQKSDRLRAQRGVSTSWRDWALVDDVRLVRLDSQVTTILLGANSPSQLASGSPVTDDDGTRQARVFFPAGTEASMTLPNGQQQALPVMAFRATEYTVGDAGPQRMPGALPPSSAYTYAVELSADQALAAGATRVDFSQPVGLYVENFIGFPVGSIVPAGWYDFRAGAWAGSDNGRVIKLVGVENGLALLDIEGEGEPADSDTLLQLGITADERAHLAQTYSVGTELWRTPLEHLTPWDCNWPFVPPDDLEEPVDPDFDDTEGSGDENDNPNNDLDNAEEDEERDESDEEPCSEGSVYYCQTQSLGLQVPLSGTPFALSYRSDRTEAATLRSRFSLRVTTRSLPASLLKASVDLQFLGNVYSREIGLRELPTGRKQFNVERVPFDLETMDAYGRQGWQGDMPLQFKLNYNYKAQYAQPGRDFDRAFARFFAQPFASGVELRGGRTSGVWLSKVWRPSSLPMISASNWNAKGLGLGGWMLDAHLVFDPAKNVIIQGSGGTRRLALDRLGVGGGTLTRTPQIPEMRRAAQQLTSAGGLVFLFEEETSEGLVWQSIVERDTYGQERTFARSCVGYNVDSRSPASDDPCPTGTRLWERARQHYVDARDRVLLVGYDGIFRVWPSGLVRTLLSSSDGTEIPCFGQPSAVTTVGEQAFIACNTHIYVLDQGGLDVVAGGGPNPGENVPAHLAQLLSVRALAAGSDGTLFFVDGQRIRKLSQQGFVKTVAGNGGFGAPVNGGMAIEQPLGDVMGLTINEEGQLFFVDAQRAGFERQGVLREVTREGRVFLRAGGGNPWLSADPNKIFAGAARLSPETFPVALPDGALRLLDVEGERILTLGHTFADSWREQTFRVPSATGDTIHEFDANGRHTRVVHTYTGGVLRSYDYDSQGRLTGVEDGYGNRTAIERSAAQFVVRSPWGLASSFNVGAGGYISSARNAGEESWNFNDPGNGLYDKVLTPDKRQKRYVWNPLRLGRLAANEDTSGELWISSPRVLPRRQARVSERTSPEGRRSSSSVQFNRWNGTSRYEVRANGLETFTREQIDGSLEYRDSGGLSYQGKVAFDPQMPQLRYLRQVSMEGTIVETLRTASLNANGEPGATDRDESVRVNGSLFTRSYSSANRTWTNRSPEGRELSLRMNAQGAPVSQTVPGLAQINYAYDERGRLERVTVGDGPDQRLISIGYDDRGYMSYVEDPAGRRTSYLRDASGRPRLVTLPGTREVKLTWDPVGNLSSITPPGRSAHHFGYSARNRLAEYRPPSVGAGSWASTYLPDRDGLFRSVSLPSGRVVGAVRSSGTNAVDQISYSRGNRFISRQGTRVREIFELNGQSIELGWNGEVLAYQRWSGSANAVSGEVRYSYGSARRPMSVSVVNGSEVVFDYDNDGTVISATVDGSEFNVMRSTLNGLLEGTSIDEISDAVVHNQFAELTNYIAQFQSSTVASATYGRDRLGRVSSRSENVNGYAIAESFTYAPAGHLEKVHRDGLLVSDYGVDENGNRTTHRIGPASPLRGREWPCLGELLIGQDSAVSGSHDAQDRLLSYGSCVFEFARDGALESRRDTRTNTTTTYSYDEFGNLRAATLGDGREIGYLVDGLNRRVGKTIDGERSWGLLYLDQLEPVAQLDGSGDVVSTFVYVERKHVPSLIIKGGRVYRVISDQLGSVRLVLDSVTGEIAQQLSYDEFGNVVEDSNPGFQPFGFAGGIYDSDTGLVRFGSRDYDPLTGRWTTKDSIRFVGGENLYRYAANDPLNAIDVSGEIPILIAAGLGYARCVASCAAINLLVNAILEDCPDADVGETVGDCATDCLNPLNWVKFSRGKQDDLMRFADKTRRKPGRHGEFKGNDSKKRENGQARDAGRDGGLKEGTDEWRRYHDYISGEGITDYSELRQIARGFANGVL